DVTGTVLLGRGISIGGPSNTIGGLEPGAGNVAGGGGIGASGNVVGGNLIGTDVTGTGALWGGGGGIAGRNNLIGGTTAAARNIIAGSVLLSSANGNRVQGNYIGTDITGTKALGGGVSIDQGADNLIGGTEPGASNLISGGIGLGDSASFNKIQGNRIGTDVTGTKALGGGGIGSSGYDNTIGGSTPGAGNLISRNRTNGLALAGGGGNGS